MNIKLTFASVFFTFSPL